MEELIPIVGKKYRKLWLSNTPHYINNVKVTRIEDNKLHGIIVTFKGYGLFPSSDGSLSLKEWNNLLVKELE